MAAEEKTEAAAPAAAAAEAPAAGGGGGNKLVLILTAVNMVVTLAMTGILFMSFQKEKKQAQLADISTQEEHGEKKEEGGGHGGGGEHGAKGGGEHGGGGGHGEAGGHGEKKSGSREFGKLITLEQFTVNLSTAGTVNPKFARVNISIQVASDDLESELGQKMAQVRNSIIDLFNSKKPSDLATSDGRNYLKEEIRNALNSFLVTGKIQGVFFTNFAVSG